MSAADGLARALERIEFVIERATVDFRYADVVSYPGGKRPTSTVTLGAGVHDGRGEHVGWTEEEHDAFRRSVERVRPDRWTLGQWRDALVSLPPYDRAALEAAAIDLALRQHGTSLLQFAGVAPRPVRYVISFAPESDPVAEAAAILPAALELKIDADPAWPDETWRRLARLGRIAVVDFKRHGEPAEHERACRYLPDAWIEDPGRWPQGPATWPENRVTRAEDPAACSEHSGERRAPVSLSVARRLSADAAVASVAALGALDPAPAAVNIKPARMGGVFEAIACIENARCRGMTTYIGGMFEVGVGRDQLRALAALACPDGPNDIAPLSSREARPLRLPVSDEEPGFGA